MKETFLRAERVFESERAAECVGGRGAFVISARHSRGRGDGRANDSGQTWVDGRTWEGGRTLFKTYLT